MWKLREYLGCEDLGNTVIGNDINVILSDSAFILNYTTIIFCCKSFKAEIKFETHGNAFYQLVVHTKHKAVPMK